MADSSIFLTVLGSNYQPVNLERIPCIDFKFDTSTGGGKYPNVTLHRNLDGASVTLFRAASMGASFTGAEIEIDKTGPNGTPMPWSRLTMANGNFADDRLDGSPGGSKTEALVLSFAKLRFDDVHDANGQTTPPDGKPWGLDITTNVSD